MIKNEAQLVRVSARISQIRDEIEQIRLAAAPDSAEFFAAPLETELSNLQDQVREYNALRNLAFEDAVAYIAQKPVLIENISELLTKLRIAAKFSQRQLADRLRWRQSNLSRFENENYSGQTLAKVSEFVRPLGVWLHVSPSLTEAPTPLVYQLPVEQAYSLEAMPQSSIFSAPETEHQAITSGSPPFPRTDTDTAI